jgi:hypothetical protein
VRLSLVHSAGVAQHAAEPTTPRFAARSTANLSVSFTGGALPGPAPELPYAAAQGAALSAAADVPSTTEPRGHAHSSRKLLSGSPSAWGESRICVPLARPVRRLVGQSHTHDPRCALTSTRPRSRGRRSASFFESCAGSPSPSRARPQTKASTGSPVKSSTRSAQVPQNEVGVPG